MVKADFNSSAPVSYFLKNSAFHHVDNNESSVCFSNEEKSKIVNVPEAFLQKRRESRTKQVIEKSTTRYVERDSSENASHFNS